MIFQCWPYGRDYVQGWIGGSPAWELARAGERAAVDFALASSAGCSAPVSTALFAGGRPAGHALGRRPIRARRLFLSRARRMPATRAALAEPLADGHLLFAGEACHVGLAGTLGGAWLSGEAAAAAVARALR